MTETAQQYTQRILGYVEGKRPIAVQTSTAARLARLIRGLSRAQLRRAPAPGKWCIGEILAHLAESEIVAGWRYRMMLSASGGPIQSYDQNAWAECARYDRMDPKRSLETFRVLREFNLALLKTLKPEMLERYGMHAERGKESVAHFTRMMAGHDLNHLAQVERIAGGFRRR
ncbi:MAG: DinB family protein [Candidatus Acidiferrales bacterium]